jgi:hypothetical protein
VEVSGQAAYFNEKSMSFAGDSVTGCTAEAQSWRDSCLLLPMSQPLSTAPPPPPPQIEWMVVTADVLDTALASLNITTITTTQLIEAIKDAQVKRREENHRKRMYPFAQFRTLMNIHPIL